MLRFGESAPPREEKMMKKKERETEGGREEGKDLFVCLWREIFLNTLRLGVRHTDDSVSLAVITY